MPQERPTPTSLPRAFALEELFFSTTDTKGHIRSGNRVFTRVSGYDERALIGAAHNVIEFGLATTEGFTGLCRQPMLDRMPPQ